MIPAPIFRVMSLTATTFPNHLDTESRETTASFPLWASVLVWDCTELSLSGIEAPKLRRWRLRLAGTIQAIGKNMLRS